MFAISRPWSCCGMNPVGAFENDVGQCQQAAIDHQDDDAHMQQPADGIGIARRHPVEAVIELPKAPAQEGIHGPDHEPAESAAGQAAGKEENRHEGPGEPCRPWAHGARVGEAAPRHCRGQAETAGQEFPLEPQRTHSARDAEDPPRQGLAVESAGDRSPTRKRGFVLPFLACASGFALCGLEQQDGPRGGHGDRIDCRNDRGDGNRQGELPEELARDAARERARHENRAQHQGHRDDRPGDFLHGLDGGRADVVAAGEHPLDVLQDDDGVVHDNADGQHQSEERDVVQAEFHGSHDGESADDRDGHVDHGQDHRFPVLEEDEHHEADQSHGLEHGDHHVLDRFANEGRRIVADGIIQPVREAGLQFLHFLADGVGAIQRIGVGALVDAETYGRPPVEAARGVVILRAQFDAGHVAEADDAERDLAWPAVPRHAVTDPDDGGHGASRRGAAGRTAAAGGAAAARRCAAAGGAAAGRAHAAGR